MDCDSPYLSLVVTSRNDDHGGNLLQRMDLFLSRFIKQCHQFNLRSELIIVEWNPPENVPLLLNALHWPENNGLVNIRIIEVPGEIHRRYLNSEKIPIFQMIGKNVGIRRAEGKFILATNIDVLFPDALIEWISRRSLEKKTVYRTDRCDIPLPPDGHDPLRGVQNGVIRINKRFYTKNIKDNPDIVSFFFDYFLIFLHKTYRKLRFGEPYMHLNTAGDFTLLSRDDWFLLRGYPDFPIFSFHLDGLLLYMAYYNNIREVELRNPFCIYHLEHKVGSGITPGKGSRILIKRLREENIPNFRYRDLIRCANRLRIMEKPATFNQPIWGLGDLVLEEMTPWH